jgi:hypothetical protein
MVTSARKWTKENEAVVVVVNHLNLCRQCTRKTKYGNVENMLILIHL